MEKERQILVEVVHNYRKYFIDKSILEAADALQMPDGTLLNLKRTGIEYDTTSYPPRHRLIGTNDEYEVWGILPCLQVAKVTESSAQKPN